MNHQLQRASVNIANSGVIPKLAQPKIRIMNTPSDDQNELGVMYHRLRGSEKKMILEDLEDVGLSKNNLYYWLKHERNFTRMPGSMQDVLIAHLPNSKPLFRRSKIKRNSPAPKLPLKFG